MVYTDEVIIKLLEQIQPFFPKIFIVLWNFAQWFEHRLHQASAHLHIVHFHRLSMIVMTIFLQYVMQTSFLQSKRFHFLCKYSVEM